MSMISEKLRKARQGVKEEDTPAAQALRLAAYGAASGRLREQEEQEAQGLQSLRLAAYGAATGRGPSVAELRETPFKAASRSPAGMVPDSGTGTSVAKQEYEAGKERARYLDFSTGAELQRRLREAEDALSLSGGGRAEDAAARAAKAELDKWQSDVRAARGQETFGEHALNLLGDAAAGFMRGVGNPVEAMARLMELPEDALYWITGDERFNQDSPDRLTSRASKALTQSSEDTFALSRPAEERPMLERALVQTAQAAGNMLSAGAIYGQAFDAANTAGLEAAANATPALGASLASRAANAVTSAGAKAGLEILRNPGNFGISLGSGVNAYSEAMENGADFGQAVTNGFAKGLTEYFSNKLFSGTPFENNPAEKGYVTRLTEHIAQKIGKSEALAAFNTRTGGKVFNWVMDKTGEGMEEVVTAIADPLIDRLTYDEDADFATADELVEEFLGGIVLSLAMSPAETLADNVERHRVGAGLLTGETVGQIGDVAVPDVDEATAALIESGLESPEGTESRRLAEAALTRARAGQEISARMRGELAAANAAQVASEESAATEVAQEERPTGDRGRQIVTEGNPRSGAAPTENEAARAAENVTLTAEDRVNAAISAEERSLEAMERTAAGMGLGENGAAYLRASYRGGDAAAHLRDYVRAYNAGVTGEELGTATGTQQIAWNAGRMDAAQSVRDNGKAVVAKKPGLVRDASFKAANISAEQERALDVLGRVTGSEIRFGRLSEDENARYNARSATITVNVNAKDPVMAAATHEIVHRIRDVSPEAYKTLRQFVVDNMSDRALAVSTKVTGKVYETNDVGYITEEMVANAFGRMAENNALLDQFVREHRTAAQRVLDALRDLIDRVRTALRRGPTQRSLTAAQNREFKDLLGRLEEAQRTMEAALDTAEEIAGRIEAGASPQMAEESGMKQSRVTDAELLRELERGETVTVYRAMQLIDGKLYPPMAAKVKGGDGRTQFVEPTEINVWYQSDERPDLVKNGKFTLNKGNGSSIAAAYNPYFHTSASPLNDQFSSAYNRPNLVVVEGVIPRSELTSGYRAEGAKDSVGETKWHAGPVASKLKGDKARRVFLSRWFMAQRIVPDAEVAQVVANTLRGEDVAVPTNVVTPSLLAELRKQGVNIAEDSVRYSLKERDDAYAAAVEGGDMETAQRMVDEAAKAAGYKRAGKWYTRTGPVPMHGRNGTYNAYRVGITRGDGAVMIHVGDDEAVVIENYPSFRDHQRIVLEELADAVYGKFTKLPFRFIRATNNKDEIEMAKAGKLKPSYNFRDSYTEKGISVSDHFGYVSSGEYKYGYYLDGRIVGYGSDGEPVLDPTTITVIGKLMDQADIDKEIKAYWGKTDAALAERGWSAEAFGAITSGFLSKIYLDEDVKPADREDIRRSRSGREILDEQIQQFGAIPEGENPVRDVPTPVKTSDRQKLSQTVRTVLEAQATPEEMVPTIETLTADGTYSYTQYSDKAAIQNAEDYVKNLGWAKAYGDWLRDVQRGVVNKTNTAIGWALYNNAANSGDTESALTVLDAIVKHQRAAAQAVQATRILKKLSPETQLYNVAKSVQRLQEEINQRYGEEKGPKLKVDPKLGEEFLNAGTDEQRAKVLQAIYKDIGRQMPTHFMDRWNAWRYLAMLGNPRTHVRNILGNAGFAPVVAVKDLTATAIEAAVDRVSGGKLGRTKGNLVGKGGVELLQAAWKDYDKVADQALGGGKYQDGVDTDAAVQEGRIIFGNTGAAAWDRTVGRALERARRFNGTALDKEDVWFSKPHYALALAQYCKANKITPEMIAKGEGIAAARAYAIKEAQKATYRDTNQFSQAISRLGRGSGWDSNRVTRGVSTVIEGILPFRKTPANILARGVEYSPLGLLRSITVDMIGLRNARIAAEAKAQGKKPPKFRVQPISGAEMIDHLAAGLTGTGLVMLGAWLASLGLIRGHGGDDDKRRKQDELMGHQNYALELPDGTSITLDWLAPECLPFFIGVNLWEQGQEETDGPKLADILSAVGNVTEPMLEMSCLQSLNAVFDTVGYAKEGDVNALTAALASAATSYLTQALPTLAGQGERTAEDKRYTTYADKNSFLTGDMQYTLGKASARIPGLDYGQIPYIDAWGREELTGSFLGRAFNNFINPSFTSRVDESAMEKELLRLYEATGESVLPQRAPRYFNVDKERKDLTGDEYVTYATARGRTAYTVLGSMVTSSSYKALSDANKARAVEMAYTYANQTAMTTVGGKISTSYKWVSEALEAKKKGVSPDKYILIYTTVTPIGAIKDADGKTIDNSRGLQRMEAIYNVSGLTDEQRRYLFECFDVGKTIIDYNKAKVEEELKKMRGK